jgi:hypothetical protein
VSTGPATPEQSLKRAKKCKKSNGRGGHGEGMPKACDVGQCHSAPASRISSTPPENRYSKAEHRHAFFEYRAIAAEQLRPPPDEPGDCLRAMDIFSGFI